MKIKILNKSADGAIRLETTGVIKEVMINEDFLHPEEESIAIGFKGKNTSGILEFSTKEIETLYKKIHKSTHLIQGFKLYKE